MKSSDFLKQHFEKKKSSTSGFSMRSMAKNLKVSPSFVSEVLAGHKDLPLERVKSFVKILEMDFAAENRLRTLLAKESQVLQGLNLKDGLKEAPSIQKYEDLKKDKFSLLYPWYNVLILDFIECDGVGKDKGIISRCLGLSDYQVQRSLDFLLVNGFIQEKSDKYVKISEKIRLAANRSHENIREYHKKIIDLAKSQLDKKTEQDFVQREISGLTINANPTAENIEKARQILLDAIHEAGEILSSGGPCSDLYQLNIQMFSVLKQKI